MSKDNQEQKLTFHGKGNDAENTVEFLAFKAKLMAKARRNGVHRVFTNNMKADNTTAADEDDKATAWDLLVLPIMDNNLVTDLVRRYANEDTLVYDPKAALEHLSSKFGGKVSADDAAKTEVTAKKYSALVDKGLPLKPTEKEMTDTLNAFIAYLLSIKRGLV